MRRPDLTFAVMDHSVPTTDRTLPILDQDAKAQFDALENNCRETGVRLFDMNSNNQGIVHVIGPELGNHAAGANDCLRRQPHFHARSVWHSGVWHRHQRSGARAGDAVPGAIVNRRRMHILVHGKRPQGRHRQRLHSRHHRKNRNRRRHRPRCGICAARRFATFPWTAA